MRPTLSLDIEAAATLMVTGGTSAPRRGSDAASTSAVWKTGCACRQSQRRTQQFYIHAHKIARSHTGGQA